MAKQEQTPAPAAMWRGGTGFVQTVLTGRGPTQRSECYLSGSRGRCALNCKGPGGEARDVSARRSEACLQRRKMSE